MNDVPRFPILGLLVFVQSLWLPFGSQRGYGIEPVSSNPKAVVVLHPKSHQVFQRRYEVPQLSHANHPGGPAKGFAEIDFQIDFQKDLSQEILYRIHSDPIYGDPNVAWTKLANEAIDRSKDSESITTIRLAVPAGGWYQIEFRFEVDGKTIAEATSEPFGVGEVFVVAGQSYATNCNDEKLQVMDGAGRVAALDLEKNQWRVAHDPQPAGDTSDGGSIWPWFGDLMVQSYNVPVGLVNVAVGGTSTSQWDVEGPLYKRLIEAGERVGDFRAVLWQQGESDVIEKTPTATYIERLVGFRSNAAPRWGDLKPWILAKSTLHPTVYDEPAGEASIRQAIETLIVNHGFLRGPDTDRLDGANRGDPQSRRHFTGLGQRNAAAMWFACVSNLLDSPKPPFMHYVSKLPELNLRAPAWRSPIVHHESAVLMQESEGSPKARLAFPAQEILQIRRASDWKSFQQENNWRIDSTGAVIEWIGELPVTPILQDQLYPPTGAANSYKHRTGSPETSLLYAPGSWFHQRNIEVTYKRVADSSQQQIKLPKALVETLSKLKAKSKFVLAVSGDSISTGLDASATTSSFPNQAGYPELVAAQLTKDFGASIELVNRSVAGWSIANGLEDLDKLLESKPDLLIVAYGMNDVGRRDPKWFAEQAEKLQSRAKQAIPTLEILWVTPMLGNREWVHTPREMFFEYRDAMEQVVQSGDSLVDLTQVWSILLERKHDLDLTGNGLNHPNDFGHRLYAQAILEALMK